MIPKFIFQAKENLVEKPWGGEWISLLKGFRKGGIGEAWEFSAHPSNPSEVLVNGQSISMPEFVAKYRKDVLGKLAEKYSTFPILVKIVDVEGVMSIHIHPSDKTAAVLGEEEGREEGILMIGNGVVYAGWKEDVNREEFDEWIQNVEEMKEVLDKMNRIELSPNETLLIPPGTPHMVEKGRFLEISNNSIASLTFFDEKVGDLEKIKKLLKFSKTEDFEIRGKKGLIDTDRFRAEVIEVVGSAEFETGGAFNILVSIDGYAFLKGDGEVADLHKGYSCLIPASTEKYEVQSDKAVMVRITAK